MLDTTVLQTATQMREVGAPRRHCFVEDVTLQPNGDVEIGATIVSSEKPPNRRGAKLGQTAIRP